MDMAASWSTDHYHFSNLLFPCPKEAPYEMWATLAQRLQISHLKLSTFFPYKWLWGPYKCIRKQNWPRCKKIKRQCTTIILAILVDLPSLMTYAKIQPQGIICPGEEDFQRFLHYMGIAAILVNGPQPFQQSVIPLPQGGSTWNLRTVPEASE